jgi:penicillin-insensitive murein endopeptidase
MPDHVMNRDEREKKAATSLLKSGVRLTIDTAKWNDGYARLLRQAVSYPEVARIFVSPAIKKELCETIPDNDHAWLRKLRPWYGHDDHFHVRLQCPPGISGCEDQAAPPPGDGCGAELANWFKPPPPPPKKPVKPKPPPPPMTLADLPNACSEILSEGPGGVPVTAGIPVPKARPATN